MNLEEYKKAMAELGVNRGGLEDDSEIEPVYYCTGIKRTKGDRLVNEDSDPTAPRAPMESVPDRLHANPLHKKSREWWDSLSPEERAKHAAVRAKSASGQGRKVRAGSR